MAKAPTFDFSLAKATDIGTFMEQLGAATGSRYQLLSRRSDIRHFAAARGASLPGLGVSSISCEDGLLATISASLNGTDEIRFYLPSLGSSIQIGQRRNENFATSGQALVSVSTDASSILYRAHRETASANMTRIGINRGLLRDYVSSSDLLLGHLIPETNGYLALFTSYAQSVMQRANRLNAAETAVASRQMAELAALAIGANARGKEAAGTGALSRARIVQAKAFIQRHIGDPRLGEEMVAASVHISPAQLRKDFEQDGEPIGSFIRRRRLEEAMRLLTDTGGYPRKVIDIALASGFDDVTSFNRAFRRHFNCTPSEARSGEYAIELPTSS